MDKADIIQGIIAFILIIGFCGFLMWINPDPIPVEKQMENCMIVNNNNTKLCEVEVDYGKWIKYGY